MRKILGRLDRIDQAFVLHFDGRTQGCDFQADLLLEWELRPDVDRDCPGRETFAANREFVSAQRQGTDDQMPAFVCFKRSVNAGTSPDDGAVRMQSGARRIHYLKP